MSKHKSDSIVLVGKGTAGLSPAQLAERATWLMMGDLKNEQLRYLHLGTRLTEFRDSKRYTDLGFPDMVSYAEDKLRLGRAALYRYLQIRAWVAASHPAWLQPKPAGFIPDLTAAGDLMWIEKDLARTDLDAKTRAALEALRKKALEGRLKAGEVTPYRRKHHGGDDALRSFLSRLRHLRTSGSELANMPAKVIADLDLAIADLGSAMTRRRVHHKEVNTIRRPAAKGRVASIRRAKK